MLRISTHTSRVGCDGRIAWQNRSHHISTHTSRVGCDHDAYVNFGLFCRFLLTHPVWDVTKVRWIYYRPIMISTHTSRVGCDAIFLHGFRRALISTHTSRVGCDFTHGKEFQKLAVISTHTSRVGCDSNYSTNPVLFNISTHTSRVGCDNQWHLICAVPLYFYSHIPCGMWRSWGKKNGRCLHNFYSHIPCGMWQRIEQKHWNGMGFLLTHPVWDVTLFFDAI